MNRKSLLNGIRQEVTSFLTAVSKSNETLFLILFTLYVAVYMELKIIFRGNVITIVERTRYAVLGIIMWGTAIYLFFIIVEWKKLWNDIFWLLLIGGVLLFFVGYFSRKMSTNAYGVVFDLAFCILACGKSFRKMLKCILWVVASGLVIAELGIVFHFTKDLGKPDTDVPGHSLGTNYPNTWGFLLFLVLLLLWYLYLRNKPLLTFALYWPCAAFNWSYIHCRTIAGLTFIMPFFTILIDWLERRDDRKAADGTLKRNKKLEWIIIAIPFMAFAVMMALSMSVNWMHQYYHGPLRNLAWRFIQGGLYFQTYGLPIFGNPYRSNVYTYVNVNGEFIKVGILDSSFAAYIIMRGMVWLTYTLLWLCVAHWKALRMRDYAIPFLETIILGFAMMERPGLEMWYNFILLYPLAAVVCKPDLKKVLDFRDSKISEISEGAEISDSAEGETASMEAEAASSENESAPIEEGTAPTETEEAFTEEKTVPTDVRPASIEYDVAFKENKTASEEDIIASSKEETDDMEV